MSLNIVELPPEELRKVCEPGQFDFECTSEIKPLGKTIGQDRALQAIEFGVGIKSHGYNIYALGPTGTGKTSFIKKFLEDKAKELPTPDDWCYVNNFSDNNKPDAIRLPAGKGSEFKKDMKNLLEHLKDEIPRALEAENFENERNDILQEYQQKRTEKTSKLEEEANQAGFVLRGSPTGLLLYPASDGKPLSKEQLEQLNSEQKQEIQKKASEFQDKISSTMREIREMERAAKEKVHKLEQDTVIFAVGHFIDELKEKYDQFSQVISYLEHVQQDVVDNIHEFKTSQSGDRNKRQNKIPGLPIPEGQSSFNKYKVNLIVDNSKTEGAPLVIEHNPTYPNLIGRIDRQVRLGALTTDFTMIKAGAIHKANGGFLIIDAESLLRKLFSWEGIKRVIEDKEVRISEIAQELSMFSTVSVEPEPIPADLKIIIIGSPFIYYALYALDKDFQKQFKVMADFDTQMERTKENVYQYAKFICARCIEEELLHFHISAVSKVVEYSSELIGDREKLSTRFIDIVDIVREASYWAGKKDKERVYDEDVKQAIQEKIYRSNRIEKRIQELIEEGTIIVDTKGCVAGQVNGLSVMQLGDHMFGKPSRITARTSLGNEGLVNIEREVKMSGKIHDKGVLILSGYLNGKYAKDKPISLSASICFEQSYSGVEGDSASSTELYALLSSISDIPLKQNIAVTGSVNQRGEIQPIGGVSQKIAGFFDVCKAKGLSGNQGVMIPEKNIKHLMLREDIVESVKEGKFHIYPIKTIDQGIEVLTGIEAGEIQEDGNYPEGSVNYIVDKRLREMAEMLKQYHMEKKEEKGK
ncbi:AAA family ATPase [Candidatus Poribacteria bacterium]|nr:AAA family ATPase [Candidatus Poribacteria bacterium]